MTVRQPTFITLFRRSHYCRRIADEDESEEANAERLQRERFASAAVGFCLKYSAPFRVYFWTQVCKVSDDPRKLPHLDVEIEPVHWADLRLSAQVSGRRFVWVVECKVGAPLEAKQNPGDPLFFQPGIGYGSFLKASESGSRLRYILLGAHRDSSEGLDRDSVQRGIVVRRRPWSCLNWPDANYPLVTDLLDSLGNLGITCFRMKHIKSIRVKAEFHEAAGAWEVLRALGGEDVCGFRTTYWRISCRESQAQHVYLGATLRRPPPEKATSPLHRNLEKLLKSSGETLAWVGYEAGPDYFRRSVWLYCRNGTLATLLAKKIPLKEAGETGRVEPDPCAVIESGESSEAKDLDWFRSVIERVGQFRA